MNSNDNCGFDARLITTMVYGWLENIFFFNVIILKSTSGSHLTFILQSECTECERCGKKRVKRKTISVPRMKVIGLF